MKLKKYTITFILFIVYQFIFAQSSSVSHPFLIVKENMYGELRSKSNNNPWKPIKVHAEKNWNTDYKDGEWKKMSALINYNMLLYVLDTNSSNKQKYRNKILSILKRWETRKPSDSNHTNFVDAASALFNSIIALDLIYNDISSSQLNTAEKQIRDIINWYKLPHKNWVLAQFGINALWGVYENNDSDTKFWKDKYDERLLEKFLSKDGTWFEGSGYVGPRMGGNRLAKRHIMDVLEFTNKGSYYNNPQMKGFMNWINTFAYTPFGGFTRFGDTGLIITYDESYNIMFTMDRFGAKAGRNGAWNAHGVSGPPSDLESIFFTYILMNKNRPKPEMPTSALREKMGAALWGRTNSEEAFQAVLFSQKKEGKIEAGHAHEDTNSFDLVAYGEHMLVNAGTRYTFSNGKGSTFPGYTPGNTRWYDAWIQNSVLIGNKDNHAQRTGDGLIDGLIGGSVEFGTTDSGNALGNGKHLRTLSLVHPVNNKSNGYFIIFDEVKPDNKNDNIRVNLQPNTKNDGVKTIKNNESYVCDINAYRQRKSDKTEKANIFFTTSPNVKIKDSYKGDFRLFPITSKMLEASYKAGNDGWSRTSVIVFPEDSKHKKATMNKINTNQYTGATINHGNNFLDTFLASDGKGLYTKDATKFKGKSVFYRKDNNRLKGYTVTSGSEFNDGASTRNGFKSNKTVSIQMDNNKGSINSNGANITFYYSKISGVLIDNKTVPVLRNGNNWVEISLPSGRHKVAFKTDGTIEKSKETPTRSTQLIDEGAYVVSSVRNNQRLFSDEASLHNVSMYKPDTSNNQQWFFKHLGDNVYTIQNVNTKRYLEVPFAKCDNRENVATYTNAGGTHQRWKAVKGNNNTFGFKPMHCLDFAIDNGGAIDGNVYIWGYNAANLNQQWKIEKISVEQPLQNGQLIRNGDYFITATRTKQQLVSNASENDNAKVANSSNANDQQWSFKHLGDNVYTIRNLNTKKYLEVPFAKCDNRENVGTYVNAGSKHQKWKAVKGKNNTFSFQPTHCLDFAIDHGGITNGNVYIWEYNATNLNQQWGIRSTRGSKSIVDTNDNYIIIYPNPSKDFITIIGLEINDIIKVYNVLGQPIFQTIARDEQEIVSTSELVPGAYLVLISDKSRHWFIRSK